MPLATSLIRYGQSYEEVREQALAHYRIVAPQSSDGDHLDGHDSDKSQRSD